MPTVSCTKDYKSLAKMTEKNVFLLIFMKLYDDKVRKIRVLGRNKQRKSVKVTKIDKTNQLYMKMD